MSPVAAGTGSGCRCKSTSGNACLPTSRLHFCGKMDDRRFIWAGETLRTMVMMVVVAIMDMTDDDEDEMVVRNTVMIIVVVNGL